MMREVAVPVAGGHLWSVCEGSGPAVIVCHGGPGLWDYLAPVAEMLVESATVYRFDQRGCGRSTGGLPWTLEQALDDLDAVRRGWAIDKWVVMGHSFGATLALAYGDRFPQHVRGIGYISGTGIDPSWHAAYHQELRRRFTTAEFTEFAHCKQQYRQASGLERRSAFRAYAERLWASDLADKLQAARLLANMLDAPWLPNDDANRQLGHDSDTIMESPQMHERLQHLTIPTLILHGTADPRPLSVAQQLAEVLPLSQFVALPACGHFPWLEQPGLFRTSVEQFLASL